MNVTNVEHLLEMLHGIHGDQQMRKNFNLDSWAETKKTACGTTCCAMGYAALDPYFKRRGLGMEFVVNGEGGRHIPIRTTEDFSKVFSKYKNNGSYEIYFKKNNKFGWGFGAAERIFNISYDTATIIFSPESYRNNNRGVNRVINRVEYLLKYGEERLSDKYSHVNSY